MGIFSRLFGGGTKAKEPTDAEILAQLGIEVDPALLDDAPLDEDFDTEIDALCAIDGMEEAEDDMAVELTSEDMRDPELLSELKEMGWVSEEEEEDQSPNTLWSQKDEEMLATLEAKIEEGKARARQLKAEGHTKEAMQELLAVKAMVAEKSDLETRKSNAAELSYPPEEFPTQMPPETVLQQEQVPPTMPTKAEDAPTLQGSDRIVILEKQFADSKKSVLALKEMGKKEEALQVLQAMKAIQQELAALRSLATSSSTDTPAVAALECHAAQSQDSSSSIEKQPEDIDALIARYKKEAIAMKRAGETEKAIEKLKMVKQLEQERASLS